MRTILVIKLCCLGDLVFLTPAIRALRAGHPGARICLLSTAWAADIGRFIPGVDEVLVVSDDALRPSPRMLAPFLALVRRLRRLRPDLVFCAHRNPLFALLARLTGARRRLGFAPARFLTHTAPFDATEHEVDRYLRIAATIGCPPDGREPAIAVGDGDRARIAAWCRARGIATDAPMVCLVPGGGENPGTRMTIKRWPADNFAETARTLVARHPDVTVVLAGGPSDAALCAALVDACGPHPRVISVAGEFPVGDYVAFATVCDVVVGGDTGPLHIAAAVGTPAVMLFGPSDPRLVAPRGAHVSVIRTSPACEPCYTPVTVMDTRNFTDGAFPCHRGTAECMTNIRVAAVVAHIEGHLAARKSPGA